MEKLTQPHNRAEQADLDYCHNDTCTFVQFLQIQKKQLTDLQEHLECYCNVLLIFKFNCPKYDLNLKKSYLLTFPVYEGNFEPTVIKKTKIYISFKNNDFQLLDFMNLLGGARSLDSFLKANKSPETKRSFPYQKIDQPDNMQNNEPSPYDAFYIKLCSSNPLEAEYRDYGNLLKSGLTKRQAFTKLKLSKPPANGIEYYQYRQKISKREQMSSFKDFLRWYNNKDVVPTLGDCK